MIPLTHTQEKKLVDILVRYAALDTEQKRRNFLWIIGLDKFNSRMTPGLNKSDHSIELIQILNHPSALTEDNQPAFPLFLHHLKDEVVPGHPEHVKFINELLNQPVAPPPSTNADITTVVIPPKDSNQDVTPPSVAPVQSPHDPKLKSATRQIDSVASPSPSQSPSPTPLKPPRRDDELRAEAERRAQQSAIWAVGGLAVLIVGLIIAIIGLGWEVMEPITYIFGLLLFLFGAAFFVITRIPFSIEAVYEWMVERELKRLRDEQGDDDDPNGGVSVEPTLLPSAPSTLQEIPDDPRTSELAFLEYRKNAKREFRQIAKYIPMEGTGEVRPVAQEIHINSEFEHLPELAGLGEEVRERFIQREPRVFKDIISAIKEVKRTVLLGEPGGGKTTTLRTLELHQIEAAKHDKTAPIPIYIKLNDWRDENEPLLDFMCRQMGAFGRELERLLREKRVLLLLDGFNEIPANQREHKGRQIKQLFKTHPSLTTVLSCRALDYTLDLGFDRLNISPLTPPQILEYAKKYFGLEIGESFFWQLAGGIDVRETWLAWQKVGASFNQFWNALDIPEDFVLKYERYGDIWRAKVHQRHGSLLELAQNPYMLVMVAAVYRSSGQLPTNRGMLFGMFVAKLLVREKWATENAITKVVTHNMIGEALHTALIALAYRMQIRRGKSDYRSAVVIVDIAEVVPKVIKPEELDNGVRANILQKDDKTVRFSHQLLQEYFVALYMREAVSRKRNPLKADGIWKRAVWWERQGWEEATVLWAGLSGDDFVQALEWVGAANPEVGSDCIQRSGVVMDATLRANIIAKWQQRWLNRLTDVQNEPDPRSRAGVGRALGLADLDTRRGVGLRKEDGLPDILWCEIPDDGTVTLGGNETAWNSLKEIQLRIPRFYMARFPITYKQFQAFLDHPNGYANEQWWKGLAQQEITPGDQAFKFWNHPRERVNWYEAMAFCAWLTKQYQAVAQYIIASLPNPHPERELWDGMISERYTVRLPTETEWEKAAQGGGERVYPYGNTFDSTKSTTRETQIGLTSAVGIFPHALSPYNIEDMSGNVWEWTLTEWETQNTSNLHNRAYRVLRGGSWGDFQQGSYIASRDEDPPNGRFSNLGFRLVIGISPNI